MSTLVQNIIALVGLGVAIDYALLIVLFLAFIALGGVPQTTSKSCPPA